MIFTQYHDNHYDHNIFGWKSSSILGSTTEPKHLVRFAAKHVLERYLQTYRYFSGVTFVNTLTFIHDLFLAQILSFVLFFWTDQRQRPLNNLLAGLIGFGNGANRYQMKSVPET